MFHTSAFFDATSSTVANTQINVVQDDVLTIRNNNLFPAVNYNLLYAYAGGDTITRGRLVTPTWRVITPPNIVPLNGTDQPGQDANIADYRMNPLRIAGGAELEAQGTDSAGTIPIVVVIGFADRPTVAPAGDIFTIRAVSASTAVVGLWSNMALAFDDTLPPGVYSIVGAYAFGATGLAFRLRIPGQLQRPGGLCMTTVEQRPPKFFLKGGLGEWGRFPNDTLPEVEVLATAADTALTLFLDVIKIG